jgi:hypothetical protein
MTTRRLPAAVILGLVPAALFAQGNDAAYTQKIKEYTTDPMFLTELVDHLPDSAKVPSPER